MEFNFTVFSNRWGHHATYQINKTNDGWYVKHIAINGDCAPDGKPFLFSNLDQDNISYPHRTGWYLEYLWNQLHNEVISYEEAQLHLQELADWINDCEKSQPKWPGWNC